jgi:hypothetical protein
MQIDMDGIENSSLDDAIAFVRGAAARVKRRELAEYEERGISIEGVPT